MSARASSGGAHATAGGSIYDVTLPSLLEVDKIEASLADGVLTLRVPKSGTGAATAHRGQGFLTSRCGRAAGFSAPPSPDTHSPTVTFVNAA